MLKRYLTTTYLELEINKLEVPCSPEISAKKVKRAQEIRAELKRLRKELTKILGMPRENQ